MHEDVTPPSTRDSVGRYRSLEFRDGLVIFDRQDTAGWIHSDLAVPLADSR